MIEASRLRASATGSGAERWMNCPASVAMSIELEEQEKKYATEGTKAHEEAANILTAHWEELCKSDVEFSKDEAVNTYVSTIAHYLQEGPPPLVEERLSLLGSSGGIDAYAIRGKIGYLFDFKYGVGVKLYANENEQLAFYTCAIKEKHPELTTIQAFLIQPRVEGLFEDTPSISSWILPWQTIAAWRRKFEAALLEVEKAQSIQAGSWCRFCKARGGCPTYVTYAAAIQAEQEKLPTDLIPSPGDTWLPDIVPQVARILAAKKQVVSWFDKAEEFLLSLALKGTVIPGFKLAEKRSYRRWLEILPEEEIAAVLRSRGIADPYERTLIPLTRAEKLVDISDLVEKPKGAPTIKPVKD